MKDFQTDGEKVVANTGRSVFSDPH